MTTAEAVDKLLKERELTKLIVESIDKTLPRLNSDIKNKLISRLATRMQGSNPGPALTPESIRAYASPLLLEAEEDAKIKHVTREPRP